MDRHWQVRNSTTSTILGVGILVLTLFVARDSYAAVMFTFIAAVMKDLDDQRFMSDVRSFMKVSRGFMKETGLLVDIIGYMEFKRSGEPNI